MKIIERIKNLQILGKFLVLSVIILIILNAFLFLHIFPQFQKVALIEKKQGLNFSVEVIYNILNDFNEQAISGKLTIEEAKEKALVLIGKLKYQSGTNYFWINDTKPTMILHPAKPALNGKDLSNFKDPNGFFLFNEMSKICKNKGEGYIAYQWAKPNEDTPKDKISFVRLFEPWGWIVGTGMWNEDLNTNLMSELERINQVAILFTVLVGGFIFIVNYLFARRFSSSINKITEIAKQIAKGDLSASKNYTKKDEMFASDLYSAFKQMSESIQALISETQVLTNEATNGKLKFRSDSEKFEGAYKELIVGVNSILEAFAKPLQITSHYVDRISKGDIPSKIEEEFKGDFNNIKENLNQCINAMNNLVSDTDYLISSSTLGRLNDRADTVRHQGDYKRIVDGINITLDRMVGLIDNLPVAVQIVDKDYKILYLNKFAEKIGN